MDTTATLEFSASSGIGISRFFNVSIVDDILVENQEDIEIRATILGNQGVFVEGGTTANARINIIDNDRMSWITIVLLNIHPYHFTQIFIKDSFLEPHSQAHHSHLETKL